MSFAFEIACFLVCGVQCFFIMGQKPTIPLMQAMKNVALPVFEFGFIYGLVALIVRIVGMF
jgi:hypothetical protein